MKYYTFTIYYSKEYKLYDLEIKENNKVSEAMKGLANLKKKRK